MFKSGAAIAGFGILEKPRDPDNYSRTDNLGSWLRGVFEAWNSKLSVSLRQLIDTTVLLNERQLIDTTVLLNERGVELHSLTENINTATPSGKLTFHLFASLAEFERDMLRQRVNAGLKAARRRGRVGGRPKALTDDDLKKARALLRSGDYSRVQVAKEAWGEPPHAVARLSQKATP
jgi:DNA invertase Pin-like site-specific DNA recombinase